MDFAYSDEQQMLIESLRKYLDAEIEPAFRQHGDGFIPRPLLQEWTAALTEFGLIKAPHSEEWGGFGMDWLTHLLVFEEVAYSSLDIAIPGFINCVGAKLIDEQGSDEIRARYLPDLLSATSFVAVGISEPDVGSDVAAVKTRAVRDGDDWVINGEKMWITNGAYADVLICTCRTGEGEITHILVDREEHGFEVAIEKLALNGQSTAQVFLSDVRVPVTNTLGAVGAGLKNTLQLQARHHGHPDRRRPPPHPPGRDHGRAGGAGRQGVLDGQVVRHRDRRRRHPRCRPDPWWQRADQGVHRRAVGPGGHRQPHPRRHHRDPEAPDRPGPDRHQRLQLTPRRHRHPPARDRHRPPH